ncbi:MAG TPA: MoxR family ATPase [Alphaproteobacteria bacterium]|nr:AAA family ATPase [Alphaproteobacteria bacterium]USO06610.1 MAG: AAA family ATPase [Rhodospirillales bacterium]HOO80966.1 MoxR family ATPase [Alphaproteobacteria bacterium]
MTKAAPKPEEYFDEAAAKLQAAKTEIEKIVIGQSDVVANTLITLASGGHVLLIGVPGLAKTLLVDTAATALGLDSNRVQCTPDLMPADIVGSEVLEDDNSKEGGGSRAFRFIKGPVFTQLLMADEINRASPRTQSALLQAMQERSVSAGGETHMLPEPFHVLATQNPIEQEGTYPLPEAQLDRFLMQVDVEYPDEQAERDIILATTGTDQASAAQAMSAQDLLNIQTLVRAIPIGEQVVEAILKLVRSARPGESSPELVNEYVSWAPGPRASQALMLATRARALLDGRSAPSIDDVIALAVPVLQHRMALNYKAHSEALDEAYIIRNLSENL